MRIELPTVLALNKMGGMMNYDLRREMIQACQSDITGREGD